MMMMIPRVGGLRRPDHARCSTPRPAWCRRPTRSPRSPSAAPWSSTDVTFAYPGADLPVLRGRRPRGPSRADRRDHRLDRRRQVDPGQPGARGSSTPPAAGCVVDGVDVRDLDPELLWSRLGLVPQKAFLFTGTVADNLRYGKPDATDEEMWEALEIAQARDFVAAMPDGLAATVSQGGSNFSGGQRQRLAIARAVVRRPEIYLFDDSLLRARPRDRRPAAGRAATGDPRRHGGDRRAAGLHDPRRRPDRRARGRRGRRPRHPRRAARDLRRPTARSSSPSSPAEEAA